ncbi:hypothetical protein, partial [Enterobacter asburiae]|uniref:hypothetical protein n=1 Tax=Enterobacter asburiae TaxID=61645 RepID=UPI003D6E124D
MSGDVRNYRIEFHQLSFKATEQLADLGYAFQSVVDKKTPSSSNYEGFTREGANKQVISSQADSLIKISRIWADFFPANTSNQPI